MFVVQPKLANYLIDSLKKAQDFFIYIIDDVWKVILNSWFISISVEVAGSIRVKLNRSVSKAAPCFKVLLANYITIPMTGLWGQLDIENSK